LQLKQYAYNAYDGFSHGKVWHWAGAAHEHSAPLKSPNADTASNYAYNIANNASPQRRTFLAPTSEGDEKHLYGQGKPMAKDASGDGADFSTGEASVADDGGGGTVQVESRLFFDGTVAPDYTSASARPVETESHRRARPLRPWPRRSGAMSRATDAREKGSEKVTSANWLQPILWYSHFMGGTLLLFCSSRCGILGSGLSYAGSYSRVTSETIGRDLNPLGRGDGNAYVGGQLNLGRITPRLPMSTAPGGWGNSVNNGCGDGGGCSTAATTDISQESFREVGQWDDCSAQCNCKTDPDACKYTGRGEPTGLRNNPCCGKGYTYEDGSKFCDCVTCIRESETRWCESGKPPEPEIPEDCPTWAKNKCFNDSRERQSACFKQYQKDMHLAGTRLVACEALVNIWVGLCVASAAAVVWSCVRASPIAFLCCKAISAYLMGLCICRSNNARLDCNYAFNMDVWAADVDLDHCLYNDCVARRRCLEEHGCSTLPSCSLSVIPPPQRPVHQNCSNVVSLLLVEVRRLCMRL
jgi:hypothetical protein